MLLVKVTYILKLPTAVDCLWGEWGEWPPCPDECGIQEIMRYRTMYEHRNGGQPCEGIGQESKLCNAWVDAKSDLLTCKAKFEEMELINQTQSQEFSKQADKITEMETEIADLQQQLNNTEPGNLKLAKQHFLKTGFFFTDFSAQQLDLPVY